GSIALSGDFFNARFFDLELESEDVDRRTKPSNENQKPDGRIELYPGEHLQIPLFLEMNGLTILVQLRVRLRSRNDLQAVEARRNTRLVSPIQKCLSLRETIRL